MNDNHAEEIALRIQRLTVAYGTNLAVWDVSLDVPLGIVMGIVGPNGAGKSTLLKSVLGIVPKLSGTIDIAHQENSSARCQIGYVPQRSSIDWDFPITVRELVLMGTYGSLGWFRRVGNQERQRSIEALERVEMQDLADRQIGELSGGQQQRAFLARAFAQDAPLLLMDEPFAGVDATTEKTLIKLMHQLRDQNKTLLVVHHDLTTVTEYFDQIALVNCELIGAGKVDQIFSKKLLEKAYGGPVSQRVKYSKQIEDSNSSTGDNLIAD